MRFNSVQSEENNSDKIKSSIITAIIWSVILFFLFWYKIIEKTPPQQEVVTKMLINFGDNRNGNGEDEPANQEGSLAANSTPVPTEEVVAEKVLEKAAPSTPIVVSKDKKESTTEKIITGNNNKHLVKTNDKKEEAKKENASKNNKKETVVANNTPKKGGSTSSTANAKQGNGDGKGNQAIGNLIAGRGKNPGSQGNGTGIGNTGDPLGGDGNGDSKIGIDRKLVSFIPGTMGRGGAQPSHNCAASGTIAIAYTVDKSGNVVSAKRSSGISDPCAVSTTIAWVKKYVKAEKASVSSSGSYSISF